MSVALIPMAQDLGWSTVDRGFVSSAFFWGYAATQVPAGYIATRVGGSKVLLAGVILWSIGALPLATASKLYQLGCLGHSSRRWSLGLFRGEPRQCRAGGGVGAVRGVVRILGTVIVIVGTWAKFVSSPGPRPRALFSRCTNVTACLVPHPENRPRK